MASIKSLCTPDKLMRSNCYSDTYRGEFIFNGQKKEWDVQYIQVPFQKEKEIAFRTRFNIPETEMEYFYNNFRKNIKHSFKIADAMQAASDSAIDKSTDYPLKNIITRNEDGEGFDIFIIHEPADALVGSQIISSNGATLRNILNLGARLLQMTKVYNSKGFYIGTVDLDSFTVKQEDGKMIVQDNYLYFSGHDTEQPEFITPDGRTFMKNEIAYGQEKPSANGDVYAVCALLWSMLDGKHYTETPDFNTYPKFIPQSLAELLKEGLVSGETVRTKLISELRNAIKNVEDGFVNFEAPSYKARVTNAVTEYKQAVAAEEQAKKDAEADKDAVDYYQKKNNPLADKLKTMILGEGAADKDTNAKNQSNTDDDDDEEDDDEEKRTLFCDSWSGKKIAGSIIAASLAAVIAVAGLFFAGKVTGEKADKITAPPPTVVTEEEPAVETEEEETEPEKVVVTPKPSSVSSPIKDSEIPVLKLDNQFDWYKSEYSPDEICAIVFTDSYDFKNETIETWDFVTGKPEGIKCYIYKKNANTEKEIACDRNGGDKILVIAGNGSGKINVPMEQTELTEYFKYKFTFGHLNGISTLRSTGSTPFVPPTPTIQTTPEPVIIDDDEPEPEQISQQNPQQNLQQDPYQQNQNPYQQNPYQQNPYQQNPYQQNPYQQNPYQQSTYQDPFSQQQSYAPQQQTEITNTATTTEDFGEVTTRVFSITASNSSVAVGQEIVIRVEGDYGDFVTPAVSDPSIATISGPDGNNMYRLRGNLPGTTLITFTSSYNAMCNLTISVY